MAEKDCRKKMSDKIQPQEHGSQRVRHASVHYHESKGPRIGARHVMTLLIAIGMTIGFGMRTGFSVAIVAMTDNTTTSGAKIYDWNNTSVILSSFLWGYLWFQVLAGYLGKKYGSKYFLAVTFFLNTVAFTMIPFAADWLGSAGVIICRIIQGLTQSFLFPSAHNLLGRWAPAEERTFLAAIVYAGVSLGTIIASILIGYTASSAVGWPIYFYVFGGMGAVWCVVWLIFAHSSPSEYPNITFEEKKYIEVSLGQYKQTQKIPTPWLKIFTNIHFYAVVLAYTGTAWGYALAMTETPTYLRYAMKFDIESSGLTNALPTIGCMASVFLCGVLSDYLMNKRILSRVNTRRVLQLGGCYGIALCLVGMSFVTADHAYISVILLVFINIFMGSLQNGAVVNLMDLSPRFSGIMMGFTNMVGQGIAILSPILVQFVVTDQSNLAQWRTVFLISAGTYVVSATMYGIFASGERQLWDGPKDPIIERLKKGSIISLTSN
ncbi:putative inorganic phosphate cotransporter [Cylas formicarius]|uniref:putative inorganic phosphate cotransporter n=1 Tax=Cylas formicarius TaxID=197179 RepID=UPI0029589F50|nr:putative inorganic phosphate cotransporter [Cylas formicarius]